MPDRSAANFSYCYVLTDKLCKDIFALKKETAYDKKPAW